MQRVFNYMAGGLAVTGGIAYVVANTPLAGIIFGSPLRYVVMLAPLVFLFFIARHEPLFAGPDQGHLLGLLRRDGLSLATVFLVYSQASIARAFFITAADFAAMSLYGYTTKRDLTGHGRFYDDGPLRPYHRQRGQSFPHVARRCNGWCRLWA